MIVFLFQSVCTQRADPGHGPTNDGDRDGPVGVMYFTDCENSDTVKATVHKVHQHIPGRQFQTVGPGAWGL